MRIRKHAKISQLLDTTLSINPGTVLQTYVCQLNQSPWDVMTFSPPSSPPPPPPSPPPKITLVDTADARGGNAGSDHRISVDERIIKNNNGNGFVGDAMTDGNKKNVKKEQCCKTDGKSWRCRREAAAGSSLCDHHLSLVKNYQNLAHNTTKKSENSAVETTRHHSTRSKKAPVPSSGSHEFYYYSGFRPGWSKKRDQTSKNDSPGLARKLDHRGSDSGSGAFSRIHEDNEDVIDSEDEDDDDDDDEEYDEEEGMNGGKMKKKRIRKPVKARSLKSLM